MGMLKKIKVAVRTVGDRFGFHFYSKPNLYKVSYTVQLTNKKDNEKQTTLIVPLPSNTAYQVINRLHFSVNPTEQNSDNRGNKYAVWALNLKPLQQKKIAYSFTINVKPRNKRCKTGAIEEYQKLSSQFKMTSLESNKFIHPHDKQIAQLAKRIIYENKVEADDVCKIVEALNEYLINTLKYGEPIEGLYPSTAALKNEYVDCGGYNTFLIAMCRSLGIPSRNVSGFWLGYKKMKHKMHAWMEILLPNGDWMPLDPSSEQLYRQGRMWASGRMGFTGSDRVAMSFGEDILITAAGKKINVEILQNPILEPKEDIDVQLLFEEN